MSDAVIKRFKPCDELVQIINCLNEDGVCIVEDFASIDVINKLKSEIADDISQAGFCEGLFFGSRTKRVNALPNKSAVCRDIAVNKFLNVVAESVLNKYCSRIQLSLSQAIQIHPGERAQVIHRDQGIWPPIYNMKRPFECMLASMLACDDFTKENGCTIVVPGSHKWDYARRPVREEMVQAYMKAGSILLYTGATLHCGGANKTNDTRMGIIFNYCLGWLRPFENFSLECPPQIAAYFSKELRGLIGYSIHKPDLGFYEGNDPEIIFSGNADDTRVTKDFVDPKHDALLAYLLSQQPEME